MKLPNLWKPCDAKTKSVRSLKKRKSWIKKWTDWIESEKFDNEPWAVGGERRRATFDGTDACAGPLCFWGLVERKSKMPQARFAVFWETETLQEWVWYGHVEPRVQLQDTISKNAPGAIAQLPGNSFCVSGHILLPRGHWWQLGGAKGEVVDSERERGRLW